MGFLAEIFGNFVFSLNSGKDPVAVVLATVLLFVVGTVVASFAGMAADRISRFTGKESLIKLLSTPKSHCDWCETPLSSISLIPVLGWLITKGRCPKCKANVTYIYPTIEGFVGFVSALLPLLLGEWSLKTLSFVFVFWVCVILSWIDVRNRIIPEFGTWLLLFTGLVFSPFEQDPLMRSVGAAVCALCFWMALTIVGLLKGEDTHAGGDVALAAAAGAWVGVSVTAAPVFMLATSFFFIAHALVAQRIYGDRWIPMGPAISGGLLTTMVSMLL